MSSLCASAYVLFICTLFTQLPVVDVRLYKGGAAGFSLLFLPEVLINSTVEYSYMRVQTLVKLEHEANVLYANS